MKATNSPHTYNILGRLAYLHVFEEYTNPQRNAPEFSLTLLIPKVANSYVTDPGAEQKAILGAIRAIGVEAFGEKNITSIKSQPFGNGDKADEGQEPKFPGYWYLRCRSNVDRPPVLLDPVKKPALKRDWGSGDWGVVQVGFWTYDNSFGRGVGANINGVQFLFKDESFGGGRSAQQIAADFDEHPEAAQSMASGASSEADDELDDPFAV